MVLATEKEASGRKGTNRFLFCKIMNRNNVRSGYKDLQIREKVDSGKI